MAAPDAISDFGHNQIVEERDGKGEKADSMIPGTPDYDEDVVGKMSERERGIYEHGVQKFSRLGWKRLTVVLIVEAVALGCLSPLLCLNCC